MEHSIDREKVIKGVEHCDFGCYGNCYEKECPYYQSNDCTDELKNDILVLLKEQDNKIDTLNTLIFGYEIGAIKTNEESDTDVLVAADISPNVLTEE